jgi:hypothetical protein
MNTIEILLADFLTPDEAASELKICTRTLDRWRRLGEGPKVTKIGRRVYYRRIYVTGVAVRARAARSALT